VELLCQGVPEKIPKLKGEVRLGGRGLGDAEGSENMSEEVSHCVGKGEGVEWNSN